MAAPMKQPTGRFGHLVVIDGSSISKGNHRCMECVCDCGKRKFVSANNLRNGAARSCGCLQIKLSRILHTKHGGTKRPEYKIWASMIGRCVNPKDHAYSYYGGRGITVCDRWRSFENFISDIGYRPSKKLSLDRIDNSKGYEPLNVRWATKREQANNTRKCKKIKWIGDEKTISEWSRDPRVNKNCIKQRIYNGWSIELAMTKPVRPRIATDFSRTRMLTHNGVTKNLIEWSIEFKIHPQTLNDRLKRNWNLNDALSRPIRITKKKGN